MHTPTIHIPITSTNSFRNRSIVSLIDFILFYLWSTHLFSSLFSSFFLLSYEGVDMNSHAQTNVREDKLISSLFRYFQMNKICKNNMTMFFLWTNPQICMESIFQGLGKVSGWRYYANSARIGTHRDLAIKLLGTLINSDVHSHNLKKVYMRMTIDRRSMFSKGRN